MITGQQAFSGPSTAVVFDGILNRMPPPVGLIASDIPPGMERIVNTALQKDREQRYQSAAEMRADLEAVRGRPSGRTVPISGASIPASGSRVPPAAAEPVSPYSSPAAGPAPVAASVAPVVRRSPTPVVAGLAALVLAVVAAAAGFRWFAQQQPARPPDATGHHRRQEAASGQQASAASPEARTGPEPAGDRGRQRRPRAIVAAGSGGREPRATTPGTGQPARAAGAGAQPAAGAGFAARTAAPQPCSRWPRPGTTTACSTRRWPISARSPPNTRRLPRRPPPTC